MLCLRCIIAHKTLSQPRFCCGWGCPIFTAKIRQSFAFGSLWLTSRISCLCIQRMPTCLCQDELVPLKASIILMQVAYTEKPMSLGDMDQDSHTVMIVQTIQHEYTPTAISLGTYTHYKVKRKNGQRGLLTQPQGSIIQSAQSPIYRHIQIYIHHAQSYHTEPENKTDITNVPRIWPSKLQEM